LPKATLVAILAAGCSTAAPGGADGGVAGSDAAHADAAPRADAAPGADAASGADAATGPYRHTISVDGISSFTADETFATTTAGFSAQVTWDDSHLYLGYQGADVGADDPAKWLLVYLDADPGGPGGAETGERYNTQTPGLPPGFRADHYYRRQASGAVEDLQVFTGDTWQTSSAELTSARLGTVLEAAIPLAALGAPDRLGVVVLWLNETDFLESAYGGLYADSFTDGYHETIPISRYLEIDFASSAPPNDPANRRP
jgi:hypothetical protein